MLGNRIAYLVPDRSRAWLVTGPTRLGYPLWELIAEADGQRRFLDSEEQIPASDVSAREIETLKAFLPNEAGARAENGTLYIGENNFAHHLWNELAGLDEWIVRGKSERLAIIATAEPLGPLQRIFPELPASATEHTHVQPLRRLLAASPILTRVGSCRVTTRLRERIKAYSQENADWSSTQGVRDVLAGSWPKLWMSVRLGSRTAENLEDFLLEIIGRLFAAYPNAAVLLDGFSFPVNFFADPRTKSVREEFFIRARSADAFIQHMRERALGKLGRDAFLKLCNVSGLGLLEAIQLGSFCDYYVCHAGTLQHKIAWIYNLPGLIHMPLSTPSRAQWHAAQVEDGIVPDLLPSKLAVSTDPPDSGRLRARNYNYRILDIPKAAEYVIASMQSRLTGTPAA